VRIGRREDGDVDIGVDDPWMSSTHARIVEGPRGAATSSPRLFIEDCGSRNGVVVNGTSVERAPLLNGDVVETGRTFWVFVEERGGEAPLTVPVEFGAVATWHQALGAQLSILAARATTADHVVVSGPLGSGKGFLARTLHQQSRRDGRMVQLDCAESGPRALAIDLFGVEGGPRGRLLEGGAGTLLLENVDRLAPDLQDRLADVLRRRTLTWSGKARPVVVDTRIVATTVLPPAELVASGVLRRPLYDVLAQVQVEMPALDDRLCDLGLLLDDCLARAHGAQAIAREACRALFRARIAHHVKGFMRVVEAAASLASDDDRRRKGGMIEVAHLPYCVAGVEAMRGLFAQANALAGGASELTGEASLPSFTGEELVTDATASRPNLDAIAALLADGEQGGATMQVQGPAAPQRRGGTVAAAEQAVWAPPQERVEVDELIEALRGARGNVSAAARVLGRPRALVMRWLRDLNIDPLNYR
jgi:DNA-binding NtrC family response regulator